MEKAGIIAKRPIIVALRAKAPRARFAPGESRRVETAMSLMSGPFRSFEGVASLDDGITGNIAADQFPDDSTLGHDQDAIAEIGQFIRLGRDDDDRHAARGGT